MRCPAMWAGWFLAGPLWAGGVSAGVGAPQALIAEYRLHDARGDRTLLLVRDENHVEYRIPGEPIRAWQRGGDGLEHQEIFPADKTVVVCAPGDVRALGRLPDWAQVSGLVDPQLRGQLERQTPTRIAGESAQRYQGTRGGAHVELTWLPMAALPAHYRRDAGADRFELKLVKLERHPAADAFTATGALRELDCADIGDEELDPFARRYILQGF